MTAATPQPTLAASSSKIVGDIELQVTDDGQPDYLAAEVRSYQPKLSLHSSSQELLSVPHCKTMLGRRRFSVAAPRVWNSLPLGLQTNCDSLCNHV